MIGILTYNKNGSDKHELVDTISSQNLESYYDILGTFICVCNKDLKKIYENLILKLYLNKKYYPTAQEMFQLVQNTYKILNYDEYRLFYDKYGKDPFKLSDTSEKGKDSCLHKRDPNGEILNLFLNNVENEKNFVVYQNFPKEKPNQNTLYDMFTLLFPIIIICLVPFIETLLLDQH
ncbi:hypothetical protein RI543_004405 [Arxiozyma heterogenica]|uniref:J domain-containing protein n=1 Tax=Arxiozyma heterogenica TaxID=278026 RepID=A0AAN7WFI2_9SACH|nr:hypothetical protein RI543_004405 [Kazachstania heterogenica]